MSRGSNQKLKLSYLTKIMLEKTDDEHSEFSVDVNVSPQFFGWIFSLGKDVRLTGPDHVVADMKKYAEEFLANY